MKYSLTHGSLIGAIALPILVSLGFSEECGGQAWTILSSLPGIVGAWYGRMKAEGATTLAGFKE